MSANSFTVQGVLSWKLCNSPDIASRAGQVFGRGAGGSPGGDVAARTALLPGGIDHVVPNPCSPGPHPHEPNHLPSRSHCPELDHVSQADPSTTAEQQFYARLPAPLARRMSEVLRSGAGHAGDTG
ncbi:hypothetical protein GCM10009551_057520 [Nocardiopsis tropica]